MKKIFTILAIVPLLIITLEAHASDPSISILGFIPAQMSDQYLVVLKICAGNEKLDTPILYVSSDLSETGSLELRAILAPKTCRNEDITIRAKDPDSIKVSFESTASSDERIEKLEKELAGMKKQINEKTENKKPTKDTKTVTKKTETIKVKEVTTKKKSEKVDPIKSILLTKSDIIDEKPWKVEVAYDGAYYLNLPDGIVMDTGVKRVIVQHYIRNDKLISSKYLWTIEATIYVYKSEKSKQLMISLDDVKKNTNFNFEEKKIDNAICLVSTKSFKDESSYVCKISNFLIFVEGLKIDSKFSGKDIAGQIMESLVKKIQSNKIS